MISSKQNQFVKAIRNLRRSKGDMALLEGEHLVGEAIRAGLQLAWLLATPAFCEGASGRRLLAPVPLGTIHEVSAEVLASVADADSPQGVIAAASMPRRGIQSLPIARGGCFLFLDRIQDPGNLGAIARVAEAAGAAGLALSPGNAHPNHPRALRSSAGSLLRLPVAIDCQIAAVLDHLESVNPRLLALDARGRDLYSEDLSGTVLLALGNEGSGLAPDLLDRAALELAIPIALPVESLNVAVAAAIALFERRRRLREP